MSGRTSKRTAAIYLARKAEGIAPLKRFAASYIRHPAGVPHTLAVIYKGFEGEADRREAASVFASLPHRSVDVGDEGFDIGAYFEAAQRLDEDYVCFLNTFTEIAADGWLKSLAEAVSPTGVGVAGAMGSYESLYTSTQLRNKVLWLCNEASVNYDERLAHYYAFIVNDLCAAWCAKGGNDYRYGRFRAWARKQRWRWRASASVRDFIDATLKRSWRDEDFAQRWGVLTGIGGFLTGYADFPAFPNPHVRTNGFIIARQRMLQMTYSRGGSKLDSCSFESGYNGLSRRLRRGGLATVIVSRSGVYDVPHWSRSGTFRLGRQEQLLLTDNQSRAFDAMKTGTRATHARMSWGDYWGPAPRDFPDLGFKFSVEDL